jgi:hypothetical protein
MNVAKLPTLFPAISFKRSEPGPIQKSLRWIVRSFHLTIAATVTRLPGDARPRNDPRGDSTIFVPNSEPSPQTYRGSALQRSAPFRVETALSICSMSRHPTSWKLGGGNWAPDRDLDQRSVGPIPRSRDRATNADHCCRGHRNLLDRHRSGYIHEIRMSGDPRAGTVPPPTDRLGGGPDPPGEPDARDGPDPRDAERRLGSSCY